MRPRVDGQRAEPFWFKSDPLGYANPGKKMKTGKTMNNTVVKSIVWQGGPEGTLELLDQTRLPLEQVVVACQDLETVWEAIRSLRVRGAPAIGIAAAYGVVVGMQAADFHTRETVQQRFAQVVERLAESRPTAVNLFWALQRMKDRMSRIEGFDRNRVLAELLDEARAIHDEDRQMCHAIGRFGAELLDTEVRSILTHCNTGGLATSEYGTALSVIFTAQDQGRDLHVFVDETRPLLQGARLTTWELLQRGIDATLICDSMAAQVMREGRVDAVITGADRIAANGDSANKIGTYGLAVLARHHGIPFYIAAPSSTFDMTLESGDQIPIEERPAQEITCGFGRQTAPDGIGVYNPAFDVTPADLIDAIITECGIIKPVTAENVRQILGYV